MGGYTNISNSMPKDVRENIRRQLDERNTVQGLEASQIALGAITTATRFAGSIWEACGDKDNDKTSKYGDTLDPEKIEAEIKSTIEKINIPEVKNISDARAKQEELKAEGVKLKNDKATNLQESTTLLNTIASKGAEWASLSMKLYNITSELETAYDNSDMGESYIEYLEAEKEDLESKLEQITKEYNEAVEKRNTLTQITIPDLDKQINTNQVSQENLATHITKLDDLEARLKKARAKSTLDNYVNSETENILDLFKEYNALDTKDPKKTKTEEKLKKALKKYMDAHQNDANQTYKNLAKQLGVIKES